MIDITQKVSTLRKAIAVATLTVSSPDTMAAVGERRVPKGDVFEFSRAAGLLAIKRTSDVIPDCHPLPLEYASITHRIEGLHIYISVEVHTIYRTGVEVEAMHGAAITALTIYDMLKPLDKGISISDIRLQTKQGGKSDVGGGKSDVGDRPAANLRSAVVVCSDSVAGGAKSDTAGKAIVEALRNQGIDETHYAVLPDEAGAIRAKALELNASGFDLVLFTGGTGLSPRDVTPEAIAPLLDRPIPGIMEAARAFGQERTPYAMLSRGVAGFIGKTLVLTLPGSTRGAEETMHALFPHILHVFKVVEGTRHEG
jgi:cyclic pyranopterin monophosphate synthase